MIRVKVFTVLGLVKVLGDPEVDVQLPAGATVATLLEELARRSDPRTSEQLFGKDGQSLLPHIQVLVNGRHLTPLRGLKTPLTDRDEVTLLPSPILLPL